MRDFRLPALNTTAAGFTLIEVIASLAILVILVSAVFSLIGGTMASASQIANSQSRQQEINGLTRLLGTNLRSLPITASLTYGPDDTVSKTSAVLRFANAPRAFAWGARPEGNFNVVLTTLKQKGSGLTLALARPPITTKSTTPQDLLWLPLIRDIEFIEWRFFDGRTQTWQKTWLDTSFRPSLVEINLVLEDLPDEPIKLVFWLPPVQI